MPTYVQALSLRLILYAKPQAGWLLFAQIDTTKTSDMLSVITLGMKGTGVEWCGVEEEGRRC